MKYCTFIVIYLISFSSTYGQQEFYLDSLQEALFPHNTIEEQKSVLGVVERRSIKYTMIGRQKRPDIQIASKYLEILRKSRDIRVLDSLKVFKLRYDSLFQIERMRSTTSDRPIFLIDGFHPELLFYDKIDAAIACLKIDLQLKNKSNEEKFDFTIINLLKAFDENNIENQRGFLSYLKDNVDIFFPFIKIEINDFIVNKRSNERLINFFIGYLKYSEVEKIDDYLIGISTKLAINSRHYYSSLITLIKIASNKALIHLIEQKENNPTIPAFSYLRDVQLGGKREVSKRYIRYAETLDKSYKDYNFEMMTIARFQTPEVVDFFIKKAQNYEDDKVHIFRKELSKMLNSSIEPEQKKKIHNFFNREKN